MSLAEQLRLFAEHELGALAIARGMRKKLPATITTSDLESAARIGLWDAIARRRDIDPSEFSWYIRTRVRGAIIDEVRRHDWLPRRERHRKDHCSVVYLEVVSDWEERILIPIEDTEDPLDLKRKAQALELALLELDHRNRKIMRLSLAGMKQSKISSEIGVTAARISQIVSICRRQLAESVKRHLAAKRG